MTTCIVSDQRTSPKLVALPWPPWPAPSASMTSAMIVCTFPHHKHTQRIHIQLYTHAHTHKRLTALCPGLPGSPGTRKVKPIWILLKQDTVSGSGISWAICKPAPRTRQTTPCQHPTTQFLQAGCPSCRPTNSVKALKALYTFSYTWCENNLKHVSAQKNGNFLAISAVFWNFNCHVVKRLFKEAPNFWGKQCIDRMHMIGISVVTF